MFMNIDSDHGDPTPTNAPLIGERHAEPRRRPQSGNLSLYDSGVASPPSAPLAAVCRSLYGRVGTDRSAKFSAM